MGQPGSHHPACLQEPPHPRPSPEGVRRLVWRLVRDPPSQVSPLSSLLPSPPLAEALPAAPGSQSAGTVVIIAILSVLLAVLLTALLALLIYTW